MKILVDADACPVTRIVIQIARQSGIPAVLVTDDSHEMPREYAEVITVGQGADAADLALINRTVHGDIVVTQDYGVAALALGKGARAINQNGLVYTDDNIGALLNERHEARKARKAGHRVGGYKKRTSEEDEKFTDALLSLISSSDQ